MANYYRKPNRVSRGLSSHPTSKVVRETAPKIRNYFRSSTLFDLYRFTMTATCKPTYVTSSPLIGRQDVSQHRQRPIRCLLRDPAIQKRRSHVARLPYTQEISWTSTLYSGNLSEVYQYEHNGCRFCKSPLKYLMLWRMRRCGDIVNVESSMLPSVHFSLSRSCYAHLEEERTHHSRSATLRSTTNSPRWTHADTGQ